MRGAALISAILMSFCGVSMADPQFGAPSVGFADGGSRYKEQRILSAPKSAEALGSGHGHDERCYDNAEIARIVREYPDWDIEDFNTEGRPVFPVWGSTKHYQVAAIQKYHDAVEKLAPDSYRRLCISTRFDVYRKEAVCPDGDYPGLSCVIGSNTCTTSYHGTLPCQGVHERNGSGTFDDAWLLQSPAGWYQTYLTDEWGTVNWTGAYGADSDWHTANPNAIPYGNGNYATNSFNWQGYLLPDVRIPAYQAWWVEDQIQKLLASHSLCIGLGTKVGWWINNNSQTRRVSGQCGLTDYKRPDKGFGYEGFARNGFCNGGTKYDHKCSSDSDCPGSTCNSGCASVLNPVMPTPYEACEYQAALNSTLRQLFAALDTHGRCTGTTAFKTAATWTRCTVGGSECTAGGGVCTAFDTVKVNLQERPDYRDLRWSWMAPDLMASDHLGGEYLNPQPAPLCNASGDCPDKPTCD